MSDPRIVVLPTIFDTAGYFIRAGFQDDRGVFRRLYSAKEYEGLLNDDFVEDNISVSRRGVLRGLHVDRRLAKFVQCLAGAVFDVIVDARPGSGTYGRWQGFALTAAGCEQLYVPAGFAHGFYALEDHTILSYKQSDFYDPATEGQVHWNDPAIGIEWPLIGEPIISEKDANAPLLADLAV